MNRVPSPECPHADRPHAEHTFQVFGTMSALDGAVIDCPGKD